MFATVPLALNSGERHYPEASMLAIKDKWIWDFWLSEGGAKWHIFFLQADKSLGDPELRHWNATYGHATSSDLVNWTHLGTCFRPAPAPAWDDKTTWTGSVIKHDAGLWHLFYTGTSKAEDGRKQRIGHATSTDLHNWSRVGTGLVLDINTKLYEEYHNGPWDGRAMRDPWVMRDPDGKGWIMYFTARVPHGAEMNARGAIGFARSDDLNSWRLEKPVFAGAFGQLEVPQVFNIGDDWYCLFCNAGEHWSKAYAAGAPTKPVTGTHYLMAKSHLGPWRVAPGPYLDGADPCRRYAGKIVQQNGGLELMGFDCWDANGVFAGTVGAPARVLRDEKSGLLRLA